MAFGHRIKHWAGEDRGLVRRGIHAISDKLHHKKTAPQAPGMDQLAYGYAANQDYTPAASTAYGNQGGQDAQTQALQRLSTISRTGRTEADQQMEALALQQAQQATAAQRNAAVQQANARGLGAQAGLLGSLAGSQADANAAAQFGAQSAFNAQGRMDNATTGLGQLGGAMNETAFNQQFTRGSASDQWKQNASQIQSNAAQNNFANQNTQFGNQQALSQQAWNRFMQLGQAAAGLASRGGGGGG